MRTESSRQGDWPVIGPDVTSDGTLSLLQIGRPMAATERTTEKRSAGRFLPLAVLAAGLVVFFALGLHHYLSFGALAENRDFLKIFVDANPVNGAARLHGRLCARRRPLDSGRRGSDHAGRLPVRTWFRAGSMVVLGGDGRRHARLPDRPHRLRRRTAPPRRSADQKAGGGFPGKRPRYLLVLRLVPLFPFWLVNLAPALLGTPLTTFVLATLIGICPAPSPSPSVRQRARGAGQAMPAAPADFADHLGPRSRNCCSRRGARLCWR